MQKGCATHSAFLALFQGQPLNKDVDNLNNNLEKNKILEVKLTKCLCRVIHYFKDYLYLIKLVYPKDQKPNLSIQKQINKKLKDQRLKGIVNNIQRRQAKKALANTSNKALPRVFTIVVHTTSATSNYYLQDSFILDSGINIYICNNYRRF